MRKKMGDAAVKAAESVGYENAATVEFLYTDTGDFYFLEMNTRIQVEHGITELVTGIDIVKEQINIASGLPLSIKKQDKVPLKGAAIECRINAEDYTRDFAPCPGLIEEYFQPGGPNVRVDSHVSAGYFVSPYYDSMVAKLMTYAPARDEAIKIMQRALDEYRISPIKTTIPLHKEILRNPIFKRGQAYTDFIPRMFGKYMTNGNSKHQSPAPGGLL
jgi:biotin carboxylase